MTASPNPAAGLHDRPLSGIAHSVVGVSALSVMDALAKGAVAILPIAQLMFLRGLLVLIMLLPSLRRGGGVGALRTTRPLGHFMRAALSVASIAMFFEALRHMPLATVIAVSFVAPLFMTALSVPMLGERVGIHRWAAIGIGFAGVMVIVRPGPEGIDWASMLAIGGALGWAVSTVLVRRLATTESDTAMLVYQNLGVTLAMGAAAPFVWRPMDATGVAFVVAMALTMVVAQWFQLRALRYAPVGVLAPFQYLELVWATFFGWLIWDEFPGAHVWLGTAIVIGSGLYIVWRERIRAATPVAASPAARP